MNGRLREILLVEQNTMVSAVIASTAHQLQLASVRQVSTLSGAEQQMQTTPFAGLIINLEEKDGALKILHTLRDDAFKSDAAIPVAITTGTCDATLAEQLKSLEVSRILLRPFKVRDVISTIEMVMKAG